MRVKSPIAAAACIHLVWKGKWRPTPLTSHPIDAMALVRPRFSRLRVRCRALLLLLCAAAATPVSYAAEVRDLRLWRAPDHTRLVFDLSAGVEYKLFTLDAPERVVIDIADSSLATRLGDIEFEDTDERVVMARCSASADR